MSFWDRGILRLAGSLTARPRNELVYQRKRINRLMKTCILKSMSQITVMKKEMWVRNKQ